MIEMPEFTDEASFKDLLEPAMKIAKAKDMELAREYRERYIAYLSRKGRSYDEAVKTFHSNIGYYAGYYDHETMDAVREVFGSRHPVFG